MRDNDDLDCVAQQVLDHYENPYHRGACPQATHSAHVESVLCGDWLRVELVIAAGDQVREAWFDGDGCVVSQAAASMLVEQIEGMSLEQVRGFSVNDMLMLFGSGLLPSRQKCCLLPWRAVQRAILGSSGRGHARGPDG